MEANKICITQHDKFLYSVYAFHEYDWLFNMFTAVEVEGGSYPMCHLLNEVIFYVIIIIVFF